MTDSQHGQQKRATHFERGQLSAKNSGEAVPTATGWTGSVLN